jgi:hypothetical protein
MIRNLLQGIPLLLLVACASVPAPAEAPVLSLVHDTGGTWPRVTGAKVYPDATLELSDAGGVVRVHIRENDRQFRKLIETLANASFKADLTVTSVPTIEWKSTGEWIRIQQGQMIGRVKPPNIPPALCAAIGSVDALFEARFGRRYEPMLAPEECGAAASDQSTTTASVTWSTCTPPGHEPTRRNRRRFTPAGSSCNPSSIRIAGMRQS